MNSFCKSDPGFVPPRRRRQSRRRNPSGLIGLVASLTWLFSCEVRADDRKTISSSDMIKMVGVTTHMTYNDGAYAKLENVLKDLKFLGVHHVRDIVPGTNSQPALQGRDALRRMVYDNIKLNVLFSSGWTATSVAWVRSLESAVPGSIASIEGYNEINNFPINFDGLTGPAAAKAGQKALYEAIKSDPVLGSVPVLDMTGFEMIKDPTFSYGTSLAGYADVMNVHVYPQNGAPPGIWINPARPQPYKNLEAALPKQITEFGYSSRPETNSGFVGVDEQAQAKGILNGLFDAARAGYTRVYLYELLDEKPDPRLKDLEFHFGLFTFENQPKPAALAIKNLTTVLSGKTSAGNVPQPSLAGDRSIVVSTDERNDAAPVLSLIIVRDDGTPIVAVWRDAPFWDRATARSLEAPAIPARISFGRSCGSIRSYDLLRSSDPIATSAGDSLSIGVSDHVQLVECIL